MSIVADLKNIVMPVLPSSGDSLGLALFGGGFAGGYLFLSPYFGAQGMLASALVGWAVARSALKVGMVESFEYALSAGNTAMLRSAVNGAIPLGVMYLASTYCPMVGLQSSLMVYGAYVLGAYATMKIVNSSSS